MLALSPVLAVVSGMVAIRGMVSRSDRMMGIALLLLVPPFVVWLLIARPFGQPKLPPPRCVKAAPGMPLMVQDARCLRARSDHRPASGKQ